MGNYNHGYSSQSDKGMDPVWKAILGVAIVAVGVYVGNILYTKYMIHQASLYIQETAKELQTSLQADAEKRRQHQLALEQQRTQQKQLELNFKREQLEQQAALQAEAKAKEAAWKKFYKPPSKCENMTRQDIVVECGNFYVKEKNRFEEMWAKSKAASRS